MDTASRKPRQPRHLWAFVVFGAVALGLGYWTGYRWPVSQQQVSVSAGLESGLWPTPHTLAPFSLMDQHDRSFDLKRIKGQWTFLFFGYTHCPDICPLTMTVLKQVAQRLPQAVNLEQNAQFAFVTVDPERDDSRRLGAYVEHFNKHFLGVTGAIDEIENLERQLNAVAIREEIAGQSGYFFSHTSSIMVIDPQGRIFAFFSPPHDATTIIEKFSAVRKYYQQSTGVQAS